MSVRMPVMNIREVGMLVDEGGMPVGVHMWLLPIPREIMLVLMVFIVTMRMRVFHRLMGVFVLVPFAKMQPHTQCHQRCGEPEQEIRYLRP